MYKLAITTLGPFHLARVADYTVLPTEDKYISNILNSIQFFNL